MPKAVSNLQYLGPSPQPGESDDVTNHLDANAILESAPVNPIQAASAVATAGNAHASTVAVNNSVENYALPSYYQAQDTQYVPTSTVGHPNGVASLDATTKVPLSQCPSNGAGYVLGPFGPTQTYGGTTTTTPLKIMDFNIGVQNVPFQPWAFVTLFAQTNSVTSFPVVEVRMSNGSAVYGSQTLVAMGVGRTGYTDPQSILVEPVCASTGQNGTADGYPSNYNIFLSAWLYDGGTGTSTMPSNGIVSASVYLLRWKR